MSQRLVLNSPLQFVVVVMLLSVPSLADSDGDPPFDVQTELRYLPSQVVGALGCAVYFLISVAILFRLARNRDWWGLCLPIAGLIEGAGFLLRFFIRRPDFRTSLGYYTGMTLAIILSPAAFLAFNYIVYGRLIRICAGRKHSYIRPEIVGRTFVISDVVTLLVQATGGSLGDDNAKLGNTIFLIGIVLQAASYFVYVALVLASQRSVYRELKREQRSLQDVTWYKVFKLLNFSSVFIIIRSIYRVIETALGFNGYLYTHEWPFLVFDSLTLAIGISVYVFYWPGQYIPKVVSKDPETHQMEASLTLSSSPG